MYYGYDATYILVIIGAALCLFANARVKNAYRKYSKVMGAGGMTGAQAAHEILMRNNITDIQIRMVEGELSDHFDPKNRVVNLSREVHNSPSLAAVSIAAHECGHVLQHQEGYLPLSIRTALVPAANIGSNLGFPMVILGLIIGAFLKTDSTVPLLIAEIGVFVFALAVLFQVVTLPVEFNASKRALVMLNEYGIIKQEEEPGAKKVLSAAAMTYVAAAASSVLQMLRLMLLVGRMNRKD